MNAPRWLGIVSRTNTPQWHQEDWLDDANQRQPSLPLSFLEGSVAAEPNEQILNMEHSSKAHKETT